MSNINQYPLTATNINDEDFYDVDYWTGSAYETRKISGADLKSAIGALYLPLAGGTMTGDLTIDGNDIIGGLTKIYIAGSDFRAEYISTGTSVRLDSANGQVQFYDGTYIHRLDIRALGATQAYEWDLPLSSGTIALIGDVADTQTNAKTVSSTQWSRTLPSPETLISGGIANGFTFFTDADKVTGGTTSYDEYSIAFGIDLTLTGTSGTANINIDGTDYLATFNTSLAQTAQDWIALHEATLGALNINVLYNGGSPLNPNGDETIRFCASEASCNSVTITTVTGDLNGTRINPFTGVNSAAGDHVLIPYVGRPFDGDRIHHIFRVNFNLVTGSDQTLALSLRRFADDTVIGSEIQVFRTQDEGGVQQTFASYTGSASDPFVTGGFYFALRNDSGVSVQFEEGVGILLQNTFEKPTQF